jgi:transcriptional regulator with XRE-family HTH domain
VRCLAFMRHRHTDKIGPLVTLAGDALGMTQEEVGRVIGVSRRTISRWLSSPVSGGLLPNQVEALARAVHPADPKLAARIAAHGNATLESLGIVPAPAPNAPSEEEIARSHVDAVVCAAADALDAPPSAVRPVLRAAFARMRELGVSLETAEKTLGLRRAKRGSRRQRPS